MLQRMQRMQRMQRTTCKETTVKTKTYDICGVRFREELPPDGYVIVDSYLPSISPWDYYGGMHQRHYMRVLTTAGIQAIPLRTTEVRLHPRGTGEGGRVRCGDDMLPGVYSIAVACENESAACAAIAAHKAAVEEWLKDVSRPMPSACYE